MSLGAQTKKNDNGLEDKLRTIEDRIAIKAIVDNFSILADKKDVHAQVQLFTPDATMEAFREGVVTGRCKGRDEK
jgi:hypothetical protein